MLYINIQVERQPAKFNQTRTGDGMTTSDKIFKAIERITGKNIVCFHDEANRYAFNYGQQANG